MYNTITVWFPFGDSRCLDSYTIQSLHDSHLKTIDVGLSYTIQSLYDSHLKRIDLSYTIQARCGAHIETVDLGLIYNTITV